MHIFIVLLVIKYYILVEFKNTLTKFIMLTQKIFRTIRVKLNAILYSKRLCSEPNEINLKTQFKPENFNFLSAFIK